MRVRLRALPAAAALSAAVLTCATAAASGPRSTSLDSETSPTASAQQRRTPALDHVFVIMLENHSKSSVIGNANAPFLTHLARKFSMAANYYGVTHPSMPNYIGAIAGDNFGIQDDEDENVVHLNRRNLVDQLERHHIRWDAYMESLPADKLARFGPVVNGTEIKLYAKKHNPFVLFHDIVREPSRMRHVRHYGALARDLNSDHAPQFVWISPNQCHDMHGGVDDHVAGHPETPCPYGEAKDDPNDAALKHKADVWVHHAVHTIRSSNAWTRHSAIVIVTDENDYTGNEETGGWQSAAGCCDSPYVAAADPRISPNWPGGTYGGGLVPAIVVSASGPRHFVNHTPYNHYSLLTTIEDNWHLSHLGHAGDTAGGVKAMWPLFLTPRR